MSRVSSLEDFAESHFRAVLDGRVEDVINHYADSEETLVFLEGPRWVTRGHANIAKGWRAYVEAPFTLERIEMVEPPLARSDGSYGFIGFVVELDVKAEAGTKTVRMRGTFVTELDANGSWKIVHEHFSQPAADPYGTGDWLHSK